MLMRTEQRRRCNIHSRRPLPTRQPAIYPHRRTCSEAADGASGGVTSLVRRPVQRYPDFASVGRVVRMTSIKCGFNRSSVRARNSASDSSRPITANHTRLLCHLDRCVGRDCFRSDSAAHTHRDQRTTLDPNRSLCFYQQLMIKWASSEPSKEPYIHPHKRTKNLQ